MKKIYIYTLWYIPFGEHMFALLLGIHLGVGSLRHSV
jgi:hypothetical protein